MDKKILIEYADMKEEIKDLRRRIENDRRSLEKLNKEVVRDSVACGKKGKKPLRIVKIEGNPTTAAVQKKNALERKIKQLELLEVDLLEKQTEVEEFIEQIEKSKLRMIFRFYYIDGLTWERTAIQMNRAFPKKKISFTGDNCRMLHDRFLKKDL